jgi:hypothetical protein
MSGSRLFLVAVTLLAVVAGCSPKNTLLPNLAPETTLFVQFPADTGNHTVNHVVHLFWFGTDPDGDITGFEWRFKNPSAPADTAWRFTTKADSIFEVFTPNGATMPTFEVRAIDNTGVRDPSPARQNFSFTNRPPLVALENPPGPTDTTYAAVTLTFRATDPDGDAMYFRVWLDGNAANPDTTSSRTFSVPSHAFCRDGFYRTGVCTVFVQAVDNGGMAGPIASAAWPVRAPVGTVWECSRRAPLLIVDDVPTAAPGNATVDTIYRNAARRALGPDSAFSVFRLGPQLTFRSSADLAATFKLYNGVIWYRDVQTGVSSMLRDRQDGIASYLEDGGAFYLEGLNLVAGQNAPGALNANFQRDYLRVDSLFRYFDAGLFDYSAAWGNFNGSVFRTRIDLPGGVAADSLRMALMPGRGLRAFGVRDTHDVAIWAPENQLSPGVPLRLPVGLSVPQPGGGRAIVVTFALRGANGFGSVARFLDRVLQQMELVP